MDTQRIDVHSQEYLEAMAALMSEAVETPEGLRALAAAIVSRYSWEWTSMVPGSIRFGPPSWLR